MLRNTNMKIFEKTYIYIYVYYKLIKYHTCNSVLPGKTFYSMQQRFYKNIMTKCSISPKL